VSIDQQADYGTTVAAIRKTMAGYQGYDRDVRTYMQARVEEAKSGADDPVVVRVFGQRDDVLADKAKEVRDELAKIDGIANLNVELPVHEPALDIEVDLQRAQEFGIKPGDVRRQAATLLSGLEVGQLFYDQKIFEVVVWGAPETRQNVDDVRNLLLDTDRGQVRLSEVADVGLVNSPDVIEREGAFRRIDVTAKVAGRDEGAVLSDVKKTIEAIDFPLEYRAELIGEYQAKKAAETRLLWLGALAAVGMLLLLQAGFGRWLLGALYFLTLPIALTGGVVAALVNGGAVSIGAAVGLLTVLGIAARNGILLIRRYQQLERREGEPFGLHLVVRGARERLAPTLMTAVATALAFAPFIVLGSGPGFEILHPMAVVVLGGLVTATLVNVFIVPALYLNFGNVESATEVDLRLFEEELSPTPPVTVSVPANGVAQPLAGAGA
jgi:Cu/Ag efflux pump CusA